MEFYMQERMDEDLLILVVDCAINTLPSFLEDKGQYSDMVISPVQVTL